MHANGQLWISVFVICVELIIYLLLDNLDDCIFKHWQTTQRGYGKKVICIRVTQKLPLVFMVYLFFSTFPSEKYLKIDNKEITIQFLSVFLSQYIMFLSFDNNFKIHFLIASQDFYVTQVAATESLLKRGQQRY